MQLLSPAFQDNEMIPEKYTCDGENTNPPLLIKDVPKEAKSLALIMHDPDAPNIDWVHWVVFNIDPAITEIAENSIPENAIVGLNTRNNNSYGGPCPPSGTHRYIFEFYALNLKLDLDQTATEEDVTKAMDDHIIEQSELIGLYQRKT